MPAAKYLRKGMSARSILWHDMHGSGFDGGKQITTASSALSDLMMIVCAVTNIT